MESLPNVRLTYNNMETLSRKDLLNWINTVINGKYKKIEELCSGVAYCQIMEQLFPNCIGLKKIKKSAKLHHEQFHNLKLLQNAFTQIKCDKSVPIEHLLKGRFQDNFEFLQWFKKFYDTFSISNDKENIPNTLGFKTLSDVKDLKLSKETSANCCVKTLLHDVNDLQAKIKDVKIDRDFHFKKLTAVKTLVQGSMERHENEDFCKRALNIIYAAPK